MIQGEYSARAMRSPHCYGDAFCTRESWRACSQLSRRLAMVDELSPFHLRGPEPSSTVTSSVAASRSPMAMIVTS